MVIVLVVVVYIENYVTKGAAKQHMASVATGPALVTTMTSATTETTTNTHYMHYITLQRAIQFDQQTYSIPNVTLSILRLLPLQSNLHTTARLSKCSNFDS